MHSILRQQEAQFVAVGGCGCQFIKITVILQKYQNTNENYVCIISPNEYDAQQNDHM